MAAVPAHRHDGDLTMQMTGTLPRTTRTWLVHTFGRGLEGEDGFVVERFTAKLDGDIRPVKPEAPRRKGRSKAKHPIVSRKEVEAMRPARTEIIVCTGLRTKGGWQIWGDVVTGIFHDRRQKG